MDTAIENLSNEINQLQIKREEYENARANLTQVISRLNYAEGEGERAYSMFNKSYSESETAYKKIQELEDETNKIAEIKDNLTGLIEAIDTKIREISNIIQMKQAELEELLLAQSMEES